MLSLNKNSLQRETDSVFEMCLFCEVVLNFLPVAYGEVEKRFTFLLLQCCIDEP